MRHDAGPADESRRLVAWPPGLGWASRGRPLLAAVCLLLFCYGVVGIASALHWWLIERSEAQVLFHTSPVAAVGTSLPDPAYFFPGRLGERDPRAVNLSVEVGEDGISIERVEPILPARAPYVTRAFLKDLIVCAAAIVISLAVGRLARRVRVEGELEEAEGVVEERA
jgi:hypothetical protein